MGGGADENMTEGLGGPRRGEIVARPILWAGDSDGRGVPAGWPGVRVRHGGLLFTREADGASTTGQINLCVQQGWSAMKAVSGL